MRPMSPIDSISLLAESREHPMHLAGLQLFRPPEGAGPEFVRETYQAMLACGDVQPTFLKRPARLIGVIPNTAWASDDDLDLDYHVDARPCPRPAGSGNCSNWPPGCIRACSTGTDPSGKHI